MAVQRLVNGRSVAWIVAVVLLACSHVPNGRSQPVLEQQSPGNGVLVGRVTVGPLPPADGPRGVRPPGPIPGDASAPVAGASIIVSPLGGGGVQSVVTDERGDYAISLLPGAYRVTADLPARIGFTKNVPATVTITKGQGTRLDIYVDTGIR